MHAEQRAKAHDLLRSRSLGRALFADPASVAWLTGFAPPIQTGPSPFAGGPPLVWYEDGDFTLILLDAYSPPEGITSIRYPGYTVDRPIASAESLAKVIEGLAAVRDPVGAETRHLPAFLARALPAEPTPIDGLLSPLRMVKTAEELAKLRRAFALTDIGHAAARAAVRVGAREIDVWTAAHSAVEQAAGSRIAFGNDCVVNYRESNGGGWPADLALRRGDSLIVDLSTRVDGYWSDSCATYYATPPDPRQKAMHQSAARALEYAISLVRPGVPANEIDRRVRGFIAGEGYPVYTHHTGHGVGVSPHEEPRIVPYNSTPLAAGMVLMLEPGIYFPREAAVRLEDAVLVTMDGAEVLTGHDKS